MSAWVLWLIAAAVLAGAESLSGDFVLLMLAGGAVGGAGAAAFGAPPVLQAVTAALIAGLLVAFIRPVAKRHVTVPGHLTGSAALVGREAVALTAVDARGGRVRLNGQEWSARSLGSTPILPGTRVHVLRIDGATAVVLDEAPSGPAELEGREGGST